MSGADTATLARSFGTQFTLEHPSLDRFAVGEPCAQAWRDSGGELWAARVAAVAAGETWTTRKHQGDTPTPRLNPICMVDCVLCGRFFKAATYEQAAQQLEDHQIDAH